MVILLCLHWGKKSLLLKYNEILKGKMIRCLGFALEYSGGGGRKKMKSKVGRENKNGRILIIVAAG